MFQQGREGRSENFGVLARRIGTGTGNRRIGRKKAKKSRKHKKGQRNQENQEVQKTRSGRKIQIDQKGQTDQKGQKGQKDRKNRKIQFEDLDNNNLEILDETDLEKVMQSLLDEIKRFNQEIEKIRLEGQSPENFKERIKEGRVLPPLLRSLQLLLQR